MIDRHAEGQSAFGFNGSWREYAPIAFTNLLLTIVTLGVYSFWARARTRRYLWSRTRFIDDRLQWTGTGLELFIGAVIAFILFTLPSLVIGLVFQGVIMRGHQGLAGVMVAIIYPVLFYLIGVAKFRAIRYRLSRTFWHGIRGGSDDQGFTFGWSYLWRTFVGYLALGLMIPWSMTTLWNKRWNAMSFGPMRVQARAEWRNIFGRYLLFYFSPAFLFIGLFALVAIIGGLGALSGGFATSTGQPNPGAVAAIVIGAVIFVLGFYVGLGLVAVTYYAAFFREAAGSMRLGALQFGFTARTKDWVLLYLGNVGLTIVTLGVGYIFVTYRNWAFFVRHAEAFGEVMLDDLTQSRTRDPGQGEGLLDAFDVGAF